VISSVEITRFRGIREGNLEDMTPLVVLVGPNGSGKSTVLDALYVGASEEPGHAAQEAVGRHGGVAHGARWALWRTESSKTALITVTTSAGSSRRCELIARKPAQLQCAPVRDAQPGRRRPGQFEALEGVSGVRLLDPRVFEKQPALHALYTKTVEQGRRQQAKAIIVEVVPYAKDLEILTEANQPIIHLVFDDHSVPIALAGDGIYSLLRISLELASRPGGVVLLEEPEVHQHPGAIRQTMRSILAAVRRDIQVILTTHSLELIDCLLAESSEEDLERLSLYRLQLDNGALVSHRMSGAEVSFARTQIENDLR